MILEVKNLCIGYEGEGLKSNINFQVNVGDFVSIVGENGEGKSTLMKTLLSLIKPISGEFIYGNGVLPTDIGYMSQSSSIPDDFPTTVEEVVMSGLVAKMGLRPFYNKEDKEKTDKVLNKLDLYELKNKSFKDLSGGQKQRTLLARILIDDKKILFLDEPTSALDEKVKLEFYDIVTKLNKEEKLTIIMISHDIESARKCSTHLLTIAKEVKYEHI